MFCVGGEGGGEVGGVKGRSLEREMEGGSVSKPPARSDKSLSGLFVYVSICACFVCV